MRHLLFLMALGVGVILASVAKAQVPVIDSANLVQTTQTAAQAVLQLQQLQYQLATLQQTYAMLTHPTNVMGLASSLEDLAIQNPMPDISAIAGLIGGQSSPSGAAATYYTQNHIYSPEGASPYATQLIANAQAIANIQGIAATNLAAIQYRLQALPDLESALQSASSITEVDAINGRIAAESQFVQAQQAQAANLQVLAGAQQASRQQQQQEQFQEDAAGFVSTMQHAAAANGGQ